MNRAILIFLSLLSVPLYFSSMAIAETNEDSLFEIANDLYKQGDIKGAITNYEKIIKLNPNHYDALCFLCAGYDKIGDSLRVVEICKKAISLNPQQPVAYMNLAMAYRHLGEHENEILNFQETIKCANSPEFLSDAYAALGFTYCNLGRYKDAQPNLQKAIEHNPNNYEAYNWLGFCRYKAEDFEAATKYYSKAIEINSLYGAAYHGLGLIYSELKNYNKAKEYFWKEADLFRKEGKEQEARELEELIEKEIP